MPKKSFGLNYLTLEGVKYPLEIIEWWDHCTRADAGWFHLDKAKELKDGLLIRSVGWIIEETPKSVVLISTMSDGYTILGDICILKGTIKSRTRL